MRGIARTANRSESLPEVSVKRGKSMEKRALVRGMALSGLSSTLTPMTWSSVEG